MQATLQRFKANLARIRDLGAVQARVTAYTAGALDLSDILRAQVVLSVSAFDALIHELVRLGMLDAAAGNRPVSDSMQRFTVSLQSAMAAKTSTGLAWLDQEIRVRHGLLTFQRPDKVADAIRLVSGVQLWPTVATALGLKVEDVKRQLELIVDRRNKIAHEADSDPTFPGQRWPITPPMVVDATDFIERLGEAIFRAI